MADRGLMGFVGNGASMPAGNRALWLFRWGPEIGAVATAALVVAWFVGVLVWRVSQFQDILDGIIALCLIGSTIALFWSRRERARLATPAAA